MCARLYRRHNTDIALYFASVYVGNVQAFFLPFPGDGLDIKWRPVQTLWPSGNVRSLSNGSLLFLEAEENHEGQYMCKLENGIGPGESKIVHLDVNGKGNKLLLVIASSLCDGRFNQQLRACSFALPWDFFVPVLYAGMDRQTDAFLTLLFYGSRQICGGKTNKCWFNRFFRH